MSNKWILGFTSNSGGGIVCWALQWHFMW